MTNKIKYLLALILAYPILCSAQSPSPGDWGIQVLNANGFSYTTHFVNTAKDGSFQLIVSDGTDASGAGSGGTPSVRKLGPNFSCTSTVCDAVLTVGPTGPQGVKGDTGATGASATIVTRVFAVATRTLNTAYQLSTTQDTHVAYEVDIAITSLLATTQGTIFLDYADNSTFTTNLVTISSGTSAIGGVLSITNTGTVTLSGIIPAGKYMRIRTANTAGTPTITYRTGQEVQI